MVCVTKQYVNLSVADNIVALFEYQLSQIKINKRATSVYILPIAKFTQYAFWALTIHVIIHTKCPFVTQLVQQFVIHPCCEDAERFKKTNKSPAAIM